jgi:hypothetical protein
MVSRPIRNESLGPTLHLSKSADFFRSISDLQCLAALLPRGQFLSHWSRYSTTAPLRPFATKAAHRRRSIESVSGSFAALILEAALR